MNLIRRDLGLQLLALYMLFVGPVILAALIFDQFASQRLKADVEAADLALARAIAQETNTILGDALLSVQQLAYYPAVIQSNLHGMEDLFSIVLSARPDVNLIYRLDSQGMMVFHYPIGPGSTVGWDFSMRDYYQQALENQKPLLSKGRISPTTEQAVATAVMPLWVEGEFSGLVATNIKLESLSSTLSSISAEHRPDEGFEVSIIDASGQVIAHPIASILLADMNTRLPEITAAVLQGESGTVVSRDENNQERLYSYVPIPSAGWGVIVNRPTAAAFATLNATHRGVLFTMGVFLVVGLFFWFALARQVIRPLEQLASFSQSIGLEQEEQIIHRSSIKTLSGRPDQIGHLVRSMQRMEQAIEARLNELSTLLQISAEVVSSLDSSIVLHRILEQVERLMGIKRCAIVALDPEQGIFRAQASRGLSKRYIEKLAIDPTEPQSVTLRAIRSGEPIQISDTEKDSTFSVLRPRARAEGYRSILAVPLKTQHAPQSALLVYRTEPHVFTAREINLLSSFANHAAMAIENALLYERSDTRLREQTRRIEALIQSLQDGLILENLQGRVLYANRRISELVQLSPDEIIGMPVMHLVERLLSLTLPENDEEKEKTRHAVLSALEGNGMRHLEISIGPHTTFQTHYLDWLVFDVTDPGGISIGRGQILRDITQNRELDRMKSSLISTVSHELRTPLAAIKGYATTLLAEDVKWDQQAQHEFLEIISNETDRLSSLVSDLLDISRIEAGNLTISRTDCDLNSLIQQAAQRAHPNPKNRLIIDLPEDIPILYVDPQRVEAILRNLIENAAKYSNEDTSILVNAAFQNGKIIIRVEDEGPGIAPEYSQRIFESFYRIENGLTRRAPGAGLGLAICQGFVHAHGGEIWLEPRANGTCVAFSLPMLNSRENT